MAIPWPSSPAVGDTFTYGGITYTWNGVAWINEVTNTAGTVGSVAVTAPITNTGTSTAPVIGIDQGGLTLAQSQVTSLVSDLALKAPLDSPTFTGTVTVPNLTLSGTAAAITLNSYGAGTAGQVLTSGGAGVTPSWTTPSAGGSFTGGTLTSGLVLAANGTTTAPLTYQSGTLLTSVTAGVAEYDGTVFYETPNATSGRALNPATYYYASTSDWLPDFSVSNTAKSLLGASTKGITVAAGTTYEYELKTAIRHQYITNSSVTGIYSIVGTTTFAR